MGWNPRPTHPKPPAPPAPPALVITSNTGLSPNEIRQLRAAWIRRPAVLIGHGVQVEPLGCMQPYSCKACGAPVRSHEPACTYCTTERPIEHFETLDITNLQDPAPVVLKVLPPPRKL